MHYYSNIKETDDYGLDDGLHLTCFLDVATMELFTAWLLLCLGHNHLKKMCFNL